MKILFFSLLFFTSQLVIAFTDQYLFCPVYTFTAPTPFAGDSIYNPYVNLVPEHWIKCNFHAHIRCWEGLTKGSGNAKDERSIYKSLNYGVNAISNYQSIDTDNSSMPGYITGYEHGYNVLKTHQLVLGTHNICWKDYLFPQTINNKQDILNRLSVDSNALVILNHPLIRKAYVASDLNFLTNYTCMEVLNPAEISTPLWDDVLTAGKPVFILGNDDVHDIYDTNKVGNICTWVNAESNNEAVILKSLTTGNAYGMTIGKSMKESVRKGENNRMPKLVSFILRGNTLNCHFSLPAKQLQVFGKNGRCMYSVQNGDSISYSLEKNEPYARVEAIYEDGTSIFLNPVFRYYDRPLSQMPVSINENKTLMYRISGIVLLCIWFVSIIKLVRNNKDCVK